MMSWMLSRRRVVTRSNVIGIFVCNLLALCLRNILLGLEIRQESLFFFVSKFDGTKPLKAVSRISHKEIGSTEHSCFFGPYTRPSMKVEHSQKSKKAVGEFSLGPSSASLTLIPRSRRTSMGVSWVSASSLSPCHHALSCSRHSRRAVGFGRRRPTPLAGSRDGSEPLEADSSSSSSANVYSPSGE